VAATAWVLEDNEGLQFSEIRFVTAVTLHVVDPLDNAVWHTITGDMAPLAQLRPTAQPLAGRFDPAVSVFGALEDDPTSESWNALGELVGPGGTAVLFRAEVMPPPTWTVETTLLGLQMVGDRVAGAPMPEAVVLGPADVDDMLALVDRTKPGPFSSGTRELGHYLGFRRDGVLVAMAGERLRCAGRTEVSAVCTDAAHRGQGLARALVDAVVAHIRDEGRQPFLHVAEENKNARRLYEAMGFEVRTRIPAVVLSAPRGPTSGPD
jgi:ribosomal protein S18 acetylase RimI-like enzyme